MKPACREHAAASRVYSLRLFVRPDGADQTFLCYLDACLHQKVVRCLAACSGSGHSAPSLFDQRRMVGYGTSRMHWQSLATQTCIHCTWAALHMAQATDHLTDHLRLLHSETQPSLSSHLRYALQVASAARVDLSPNSTRPLRALVTATLSLRQSSRKPTDPAALLLTALKMITSFSLPW